jgi:hypothetical protein
MFNLIKTRKSIFFLSFCFFALLISALIFGCRVKKNNASLWQPPVDEYAFVEYYQVNEGIALEGTPPPGRRIDGPTYSFSPELGELTSYISSPFSKDSLLLVLARGLVLRGTEGGGLHSRLIPVFSLPFTESSITIEAISSNEVHFLLDEQRVSIPIGQEWVRKTESIDTLSFPEGNVIVQRSKSVRVIFHGFLKKEKLTFN